MKRAFVREDDESAGVVPLPDRLISPQRNLVTRRGLQQILRKVAEFQVELADAAAADDARERAARELRYWTARRGTAEVSEPDARGRERRVRDRGHRQARGRRVLDLPHRRRGRGRPRRRPDRLDGARGAGTARRRAGEVRMLPTGEVEVLAIAARPSRSNRSERLFG